MKKLLIGVIAAVALVPLLTAAAPAAAAARSSPSGRWAATGSLTAGHGTADATLLPNGEVLVAGGADYNWTPYATAELYNPATGGWAGHRQGHLYD